MIRIFRALVPISALVLLFGDLVLAIASFLAAAYVFQDLDVFLTYESGHLQILAVLCTLFGGFYFQDFYSQRRNRTHIVVLQQICLSIGMAFLFQAVASAINSELVMPRRVMLAGSFLTFATIFCWQALFQVTLGNATGSQSVIFVGASPAVFELAGYLAANPALGLAVSGYIDHPPTESGMGSLPWLGPADQCLEIIDAQEPAWIIIGRPEELRPWWVDKFLELRFGGVQIEEVDKLFGESLGRVCVKQMRPSDLALGSLFEPGLAVRLQTTFSSMVAMPLSVLLSPVLAGIALLAKLSSAGSVLTRTRVAGLYGVPFSLYRFRCTTDEPTGERRTTSLGKVLQRLKVDGLPQLFNVAAGDMSFIGPSPQRIEYSQRLSHLLPFYPQRHITKPGLIGWAKLKSAHGDDALRLLEYDLYYSKNTQQGSILTMDFMILTGAVKKLLNRIWSR